jgi:hypothetical protein
MESRERLANPAISRDAPAESSSTAMVVFSYSNPFHDAIRSQSRLFTLFGKNLTIEQRWKEGGELVENLSTLRSEISAV